MNDGSWHWQELHFLRGWGSHSLVKARGKETVKRRRVYMWGNIGKAVSMNMAIR